MLSPRRRPSARGRYHAAPEGDEIYVVYCGLDARTSPEPGERRGGDIAAAALTAYVREEDRESALAVGSQTHIAKPVDPAALAAAAWLAKQDGRARSPRGEVPEL